jgi:hypothetical protein
MQIYRPNSPPSEGRRLFEMFAAGVAYVSVTDKDSQPDIGTCFHIGAHVFVTARHVVEGKTVSKIATTVTPPSAQWGSWIPSEAKRIEGPFYHPNPNYDIAALKLPDLGAPQIPFHTTLEDPFNTDLLLQSVVVMGYPKIPGSKAPVLVCARAEVNASFETYFDNQKVLLVSCMARGGFSGGPAATPPHHCLGVVTRAMVKNSLPEELGFMAVVGPLPILELLDHHRIMPNYLRQELWEPYRKAKRVKST